MQEDHLHRLRREQQIAVAGQAARAQDPPPPYHIYDVEMIYLLCRFDPAAIRRILPGNLEPTDDGLGVIMVLHAPRGWVITPFSACVAGVHVKGHDGIDKFPASFLHTAFYSGDCGELFKKFYSKDMKVGSATVSLAGPEVFAQAGLDGTDTIRIRGRRTERVGAPLVSMNHYLARFGNDLNIWSTSYSTRFRDLDELTVEIRDTAPEPLRSLRPLEIVWPICIEGMQMTFNTPKLLHEAGAMTAEALQAALFDVLRRLGRAAAVVTAGGRPIFVTPEAASLLSPLPSNLLTSETLRRRSSLTGAVARTVAQGARGVDPPILLEHASGRPIFAQVLPVFQGVVDEPAVIILFSDPAAGSHADVSGPLQMLGLTPAEARIAALVGEGRSSGDAAVALGLTLNTVRSALKDIYGKLGLTRQSQLARLFARLEMLGASAG